MAKPPPKAPPAEEKPAAGKKARAAPRRSTRITVDHPDHGKIEISHRMSDRFWGDSVPLAALSDGPEKRVWIQIGKVGRFNGHGSGPFELGAKEFGEIVRNFRATQNRAAPIDFEHASEAEPTSGNVATEGAPAQGWIHELDNRGDGGLWGLVEWLEPAASLIKAKKYKWISPAIRFSSRDRVTGQNVGARLTSAGLTNQPFLDGMMPLAAKDTPGVVAAKDSPRCYTSHETMPKLRSCLRLSDLASPEECGEHLDRLSDMLDKAGGDAGGRVHGVQLGDYLTPLRDLAQAAPHHTWDDVFEAVRSMIRAAIAEHVVEEHDDPNEADASQQMRDTAPAAPSTEPPSAPAQETTMDETSTKLLRDAEAKTAEVSVQLKETTAKLTALEAENKLLRDLEDKRACADREREVDETISTYADKKGLSEDNKPALLSFLAAAPDAFRKMYPPVKPSERHLLRNLTGPREASQTVGGGAGGGQGAVTMSDRIAKHRKDGKSHEAAVSAAYADAVREEGGV